MRLTIGRQAGDHAIAYTSAAEIKVIASSLLRGGSRHRVRLSRSERAAASSSDLRTGAGSLLCSLSPGVGVGQENLTA
jgi:hypothetical protein